MHGIEAVPYPSRGMEPYGRYLFAIRIPPPIGLCRLMIILPEDADSFHVAFAVIQIEGRFDNLSCPEVRRFLPRSEQGGGYNIIVKAQEYK